MRCRFCGRSNNEEDHRCQHCGRRLDLSYPVERSAAIPQPDPEPKMPGLRRMRSGVARQEALFGERTKVIPIETLAPGRVASRPDPAHTRRVAAAQRTVAAGAKARRLDQPALDLAARPPQQPEATYTGAEVAPAPLRLKAAGFDAALCATGTALAAAAFHFMGGSFLLPDGKALYALAATLGALVAFYHLFWAVMGSETPGQRWAGLRIVTFDGYSPGWRRHVVRLAAKCLSALPLGIGLVWAVLDEEGLAWHDQMTETFPTIRNPRSSPFQRR